MNRKNILALISLVLVMVFVLSACGKAGNVSEAKTPESQALAFHTDASISPREEHSSNMYVVSSQ